MQERYRTDRFVQELYRRRPGKLRFDPEKIRTAEAFAVWREQVTQQAYTLMQFPEEMYEEPEVRFLLRVQRDGYRIEKYEISPEPDLWVPFLVMIPDEATVEKKAPGVLCFPGWDTPKEALCGEKYHNLVGGDYSPMGAFPYENAIALHCVRRGMVALASDNAGTCEQDGEYERQQLALKLIFKGRNYVGLCVEYRWAMLKWLIKQAYVDADRIGLVAHSLGTETSMFLALLEPRIKAVCHNDFMSDNEQRILSCYPPEPFAEGAPIHIVPGMHEWFSFPDLIAAAAPTPYLLTEGGVQADLERIGKAYRIVGAADAYEYHHYAELADPAKRRYDYQPIPEGITTAVYFQYANVIPEQHYFKYRTCIPWLAEQLKK